MVINGVDITPIVTSILEVLLGLLVTWFATKAVPWIKEKLNGEQLELVKQFIDLAVRAAEQIFPADQWKEKLEYVIKLVEDWLASKGMKLDIEVIKAMIEAAVLEMKKELYPEELQAKRTAQLEGK